MLTVVLSAGYSSSQQNQLQHPGHLGKSTNLTSYLLTTHKTQTAATISNYRLWNTKTIG
jgi:hypothetical protein